MNMLVIPWLHFSVTNNLWKKNISLSSSVLFSGHLYSLLNLPALSHPQHQISLKLSNTSSLTSPHYRVAVIGPSRLLDPLISPSIHEIPLQVLLIFFLYCFPLFFRKLSPYACSITILFPQVASSFGHCYRQYTWLGLTQYGLSYVNPSWKYSLNLCICLLPANTIP